MDKTSFGIITYLSLYDEGYSRSAVHYRHKNSKFKKVHRTITTSGFSRIREIRNLTKNTESKDTIFLISSPSHILVPILYIFCRTIILDAGWPLTQSNLIRNKGIKKYLKIVKSYFIDFTAMHLSKIVLVESHHQANNINKMYLVGKSKIKVLYTGIDETIYDDDPVRSSIINEIKKRKKNGITILFRGKLNKESGILDLLKNQILRNMDNTLFIFICPNLSREILNSGLGKNYLLIDQKITNSEMKQIYELADVALGQLSNAKRLKFTIPHKAFEAMYFRTAYMTYRNPGICEILPSEDQAIFVNEISIRNKILQISKRNISLKHYAENAFKRYEELASQDKIADGFYKIISSI